MKTRTGGGESIPGAKRRKKDEDQVPEESTGQGTDGAEQPIFKIYERSKKRRTEQLVVEPPPIHTSAGETSEIGVVTVDETLLTDDVVQTTPSTIPPTASGDAERERAMIDPHASVVPSTSEIPPLDKDSDDVVEVDTSVLLGKDWNQHVAHALLKNPEARGLIGCKAYTKSLKKWDVEKVSDEFKRRLVGNPLVKLVKNTYDQAERVVVSAFVERWQPETNTFHLPFGEMMITLDDVRCMFGLPVEGKPVTFDLSIVEDIAQWVSDLLGIDKPIVAQELARNHGNLVCKSWLFKNVAGKGGNTISVDQAVRGYLLYLLACTLFANRSGDKIGIGYLHCLEKLDSISKWAWGAACLALLYRQLSHATRLDAGGVSGYLALFEGWVYEHFPKLRPAENPKFDKSTMCRHMKWLVSKGGVELQAATKLLVQLRKEIDLMISRDVIWDPYKDVRPVVPENDVCWYYGCIRTMDIVEAYHPNRVVRQFGHVQLVPQNPIPPKTSSRSGNVKKYNVAHNTSDDDFINYRNRLVNKEDRGGIANFDSECHEGYMKWYRGVTQRRLTRVYKKKQRDPREEEESKAAVLTVLSHVDDNFKKVSKHELHIAVKMAREFISTGVCTAPQPVAEDIDEEQADVEAQTTKVRKKRGKISKKK